MTESTSSATVSEERERSMTFQELVDLPVSFPLDTANRALSLRRSTGYELAKRGEYPVRVFRAGKAYRVARSDLLRHLGIDPGTPAPTHDTTITTA